MKGRNEKAERALFYSIWAVLLIGFALWKVRPGPEKIREVSVRLAPEVRPWFSEGLLQRFHGNSYTIGLVLTPEYKRTLRKEPTSVYVGYRVTHPTLPPFEGNTTVHITPESSLGTALVTDSGKENAAGIEFFLRH